MQRETQIIPPKETPQVKAFHAKLVPLKERRAALDAKWSACASLANPYNNAPATERARVEAELAIPRLRDDFKRIDLDIADLERERDQVLKAEQLKVEAEIDRQLAQELAQLRRDFEQYVRPRNGRIHELEELKEKLTGKQVSERFAWWDLLDETATSETRWGHWTRKVLEYFGHE